MTTSTSEVLPWRKLYESVQLDKDIQDLFDERKIQRLCELIGPRARPWSARRGVRSAVKNYIWARFIASERAPGDAEWSRMSRFVESGQRFSRDLSGLMTSGAADKRVLINPLDATFNLGQSQPSLFRSLAELGGPGSLLPQIKQLVDLLVESAQNAVEVAEGDNAAELRADYLKKISLFTTPDDKRNLDRACLLEGTKAFARYWRAVSKKPFNAGKYYPEAGQHIGAAVEAMHLVFATIDPTITERRIATIIRDFNAI